LDVQLFKDESVKVEHPMPARVEDPHLGPSAICPYSEKGAIAGAGALEG